MTIFDTLCSIICLAGKYCWRFRGSVLLDWCLVCLHCSQRRRHRQFQTMGHGFPPFDHYLRRLWYRNPRKICGKKRYAYIIQFQIGVHVRPFFAKDVHVWFLVFKSCMCTVFFPIWVFQIRYPYRYYTLAIPVWGPIFNDTHMLTKNIPIQV